MKGIVEKLEINWINILECIIKRISLIFPQYFIFSESTVKVLHVNDIIVPILSANQIVPFISRPF